MKIQDARLLTTALALVACVQACGGGGGGNGSVKVTSQLVSQQVPSACFIEGELEGGDGCFPTADFHFVLDDGSETETFVLGNGKFQAVICRHPTGDLTACPDFTSVLCSQVVSYVTSTDQACAQG